MDNFSLIDEETTDEVKCFAQIAEECVSLYSKKNHDYGNSFDESLDKLGQVAAVTRIYDKTNRLVNLIAKENKNQVNESLDDTLIDLACYAIMTLSYRRRNKINVEFDKK